MMDAAMGKLLQMIRTAIYMIRKGFSKQKLAMELQLLFKRGKLAGKAIGNLLASHHHGHGHGHGHGRHIGGCRSMDPDQSFYSPGEVEFSCSNTPSYPASCFLSAGKRKTRRRPQADRNWDGGLDVDALAKQLERLSLEVACEAESSPPPVRQLRITDSPFPVREEDGEADGGRVDWEAEEFIKRFYELQRLQRSVQTTPDQSQRGRRCERGG